MDVHSGIAMRLKTLRPAVDISNELTYNRINLRKSGLLFRKRDYCISIPFSRIPYPSCIRAEHVGHVPSEPTHFGSTEITLIYLW